MAKTCLHDAAVLLVSIAHLVRVWMIVRLHGGLVRIIIAHRRHRRRRPVALILRPRRG